MQSTLNIPSQSISKRRKEIKERLELEIYLRKNLMKTTYHDNIVRETNEAEIFLQSTNERISKLIKELYQLDESERT